SLQCPRLPLPLALRDGADRPSRGGGRGHGALCAPPDPSRERLLRLGTDGRPRGGLSLRGALGGRAVRSHDPIAVAPVAPGGPAPSARPLREGGRVSGAPPRSARALDPRPPNDAARPPSRVGPGGGG